MTKISIKLKHLAMLPLCALFFFIGAVTVQATTYYVATTGNDSSPGSLSQPFLTINRGLSVLRAGDTLYIRGGTYPEAIDSNAQTLPTGTSWSDAPTIAAYPGETVTLRPTGCGIISLAHNYIQYLIFKNLILDGALLTVSLNFPCEDIGFGSVGSTVNHIRFDGLEVKNSPWNGVALRGSYHEFLNVHVHHNGAGAMSVGYISGTNGVYGVSQNTLFRGGSYHDNQCYGIREFYSSAGFAANDNIVEQAQFYNNGRDKAFGGTSICNSGGGGIIFGDQRNIARNNIVYNNHHGLTSTKGGNVAADNKYLNNTVYGNTVGFSLAGTSLTGTVLINNIFSGNGTVLYDPFSQLATATTNLCAAMSKICNVAGDPAFVNPGGNDFHLRSSSPAIDAGTTLSLVTRDFVGLSRPQGPANDIGAYEGTGTTDSTAPSPPANLTVK